MHDFRLKLSDNYRRCWLLGTCVVRGTIKYQATTSL